MDSSQARHLSILYNNSSPSTNKQNASKIIHQWIIPTQISFVVMFVFNIPGDIKNKHLVFSKSFNPIFWHVIETYEAQITHAISQNEITQFTPEHMVLQTNPAHIFHLKINKITAPYSPLPNFRITYPRM